MSDRITLWPGATPPMHMPPYTWALLVSEVDIEGTGEVALFAGEWVAEQSPATGLFEGDLVVRLHRSPNSPNDYDAVDVEMLLAYKGAWRLVGEWPGLGESWPDKVAHTAAALMGLHCDLEVAASLEPEPQPQPVQVPVTSWLGVKGKRRQVGGIADLLRAGLLSAGETLVWPAGRVFPEYRVTVLPDGSLRLPDGRMFASPTAVTTALGANQQNGWLAFRTLGGLSLADLRKEWASRRNDQ